MSKIDPKMANNLEMWDPTDLVPYANNARTHSDGQINQIAASIREFGFNSPILVDRSKGIIAGHGRLRAAQLMKLDKVPVIVLDHLTDAQKRAYILADNKIAENAGWDEEILRLEIADLDDLGTDFDAVGFSDEELDKMLMINEEEKPGADVSGSSLPKNPGARQPDPGTPDSLDGQVRKVSMFFKPEQYEILMAQATHIIAKKGLSDMSELFEYLIQKERMSEEA